MTKHNEPSVPATPAAPAVHRTEPLLLHPTEAARLLAISPRKLWQLTAMQEVPSVRIGRCLRYAREDIEACVARYRGTAR